MGIFVQIAGFYSNELNTERIFIVQRSDDVFVFSLVFLTNKHRLVGLFPNYIADKFRPREEDVTLVTPSLIG